MRLRAVLGTRAKLARPGKCEIVGKVSGFGEALDLAKKSPTQTLHTVDDAKLPACKMNARLHLGQIWARRKDRLMDST
jgi:hypothetical protein